MISLWLSIAFAAEVQRYAVVVGANEGLPSDGELLYAEEDATRVASLLEDIGDIQPENITRLRGVTADRVLGVLSSLQDRMNPSEDVETLLFFYYSGHGDADGLHLSGTELDFSTLSDALSALDVDVRVLVVDACQSGELTRIKGAAPAEPFEIHADDRLDTEGMAIITSGSFGEDAQESDRLGGGIFTHHFLAGLQGAADESGDHRVTLTEAYRYGYAETVKTTSRARFVQRPSFGFELSGRSDLVLTRLDDPGRNAMLALTGGGEWLIMNATSGELITEVSVNQNTLIALNPGEYLVRHRDDRGIQESTLTLPRGETRPLVAANMRVVPPGQTVRKGMVQRARTALAITIGGGIIGPTSPGIGIGPVGSFGLLADLEPLSIAARITGTWHSAENPQLTLSQGRVGFDLAGIKKIDVGPTAFGLGVRAGTDLTFQWFKTDGDAPARRALTGRVGPVLSLDLPFGKNLAIIGIGTDVQLYQRYDAYTDATKLDTAVVPTLQLELAHYVN